LPDVWESEPRKPGLVAVGLGMNWQNEHSLRFLFPASECGTDQGGDGDNHVSGFKLDSRLEF
jgi:hypothetical protein